MSVQTEDPYNKTMIVVLRKNDALCKHPGLLSRGSMFGFTEISIWKTVIDILSAYPINYTGGEFDSNTASIIMDIIGYLYDEVIGSTSDFSDTVKMELEQYSEWLLNTAFHCRCLMPIQITSANFINVQENCITIMVHL